jgi:lysozyme family protein
METNYRRCVNFVLEREGGYVNDPDDPGGATNMGVTIATLGAWLGRPATVGDVQRLKRSEAERIYHKRYWTAASCPELPAGVDLLVMDACVLSGIEPALNFLRRQLGLPAKMQVRTRSGSTVYPKTDKHLLAMEREQILQHAQAACMPALIMGVSERRRDFYRSLSTFSKYGRGWLRRVDAAQSTAMHLWATDLVAVD